MDRKKDIFGNSQPTQAEWALILNAAMKCTQEGSYSDKAIALLDEIPDEIVRNYIFNCAPPRLVPEMKGYFVENTLPTIKAVLSDVIDPDFYIDIEAFTADAERGTNLFFPFLTALGESQNVEGLPAIYINLISGKDVTIGESETPDGPIVKVRKIDGHTSQRRAALAMTCARYKSIEELELALDVCTFMIGS